MGRSVRQKRKNRSSRATVQTHNKSKKKLNPLGNDIIARNWNKNETLTQNYRRLGLATRLQKVTGGSDPILTRAPDGSAVARAARPKRDPLTIDPTTSGSVGTPSGGAVREVRVERDARGRIVRVLDGRAPNPLADPLNELDSDSDSDSEMEEGGGATGRRQRRAEEHEWGGLSDREEGEDEDEQDQSRPEVIRQLEKEARRPVVRTPRHQSGREVEWLQRLVDRHGDDVAAMARDRRLNPMQQTAADIAKRIKKWRKN